jgi:hypothetical protein
MFRFLRSGPRDPVRSAQVREPETSAVRSDDKLPERPSLEGYLVYELPDGLADLLVNAFRRRPR